MEPHKRLQNLRKELDLSQDDMAKILGMSRPGYNFLENGHRKLDTGHIDRLSKALNIPPAFLFIDPVFVARGDEEVYFLSAFRAADKKKRAAIAKDLGIEAGAGEDLQADQQLLNEMIVKFTRLSTSNKQTIIDLADKLQA